MLSSLQCSLKKIVECSRAWNVRFQQITTRDLNLSKTQQNFFVQT